MVDVEVVTYERETLYREVWSEPVSTVAKRYKISDNALRKHCKKLLVPLPPRGYWVQSESRRRRQIPPLPKGNGLDKISVRKQAVGTPDMVQHTKLSFLPEDKQNEILEYCSSLVVSQDTKGLHPLAVSTMRYAKSKNRSTAPVNEKDVVAIGTSEEQSNRALLIMNAILKAVEHLGYSVKNKFHDTRVCNGQEEVKIGIKEKQKQVPHVLTKDEERQRAKGGYVYTPPFDYVFTSLLTLYIDEYHAKRKNWRDTARKRIEDSIGEFIIAIIQTAEDLRVLREQREEERRRGEEAELRRLEQEIRRDREIKSFRLLRERSNDYEESLRIRKYTCALTNELDRITDLQEKAKVLEYIHWANAKADWLDPLVNRKDPILGVRHERFVDELKNDEDD